jgi:Domain of unknown function (DUF4939)/Zinc knuckle
MPRPPPPITPDSYEAFEQHASGNLRAWFEYLQQSIAYSESLELQSIYLQEQSRKEKEGLQAVKDYQSHLISELQDKLATAVARERQALAIAVPTVNTPGTSEPLPTQLAEPASVPLYPTPSPPSTSHPYTDSHLSERIPDPPEFEGDRKDFSRFSSQIYTKLIINADRFLSPQSRLAYLTSRLKGPAFAQLLPYSRNGVSQLKDYQEGLDVLERAFGDPNRVSTARKELLALRQSNKEFGIFFAEFHRLALESQMHEDALPTILENALSKELREQLISATNLPTSDYHAFARSLQELENRRRYYTIGHSATQPSRRPVWNTPLAPTSPGPQQQGRNPVLGDPMDLSTRRSLQPLSDAERQLLREKGACFRCRKAGHMAAQCPNFPTPPRQNKEPFRPRAAIDSHSHHSESDSENGMSLSRVGSRDRN